MNKYQSHKIVEAGQITAFRANVDGRYEVFTDKSESHLLDEDVGERIQAAARKIGVTPLEGFLMVYKDGYISWAPNHTMEDYDLMLPGNMIHEAIGYLAKARIVLQNENQTDRRSRELSVAITELETAILWVNEDQRIKQPEEFLARLAASGVRDG